VDCFFSDINKAFDQVSHSKLLFVLERYGISGNLLAWFRCFLSNRRQRVKVGRSFSAFEPNSSGVPQGGVSSPLVFILYVNCWPSVVTELGVQSKLFADDGKCYLAVQGDSSHVFSAAVNASSDHLQSLQLRFSLPKCSIIHFGRSNPDLPLSVSGSAIKSVDCERDLGVFIDQHLTFATHYATIVQRAFGRMHQLLRSFEIRDRQFLVQLFRVYVLPIVMYASEVWSPYLLKDIDGIEKVQRWWTKRIPGLHCMSYIDRLNLLGLESLELLRLKADLLFAYKVCNGLVTISNSSSFLPRVGDLACGRLASNRGHAHKLIKLPARLGCRRYFFTCRIFQVWNALQPNVANACSLEVFRAKLSMDGNVVFTNSHCWSDFLKGRALKL